jgi:hypothetical protein
MLYNDVFFLKILNSHLLLEQKVGVDAEVQRYGTQRRRFGIVGYLHDAPALKSEGGRDSNGYGTKPIYLP